MSILPDLREHVRQRAGCACEYCGVTETDVGGPLTIDHYQPRVHGGIDSAENLLYCCQNCNQFKAAYWPTQPGEPVLWNPRFEPPDVHFLTLDDGSLCPITPTGAFTLRRVRLNRPPLIAYRRRRRLQAEEVRLLNRYREIVGLLRHVQAERAQLLEEQRELLAEQRRLLRILLDRRE